MEDGPFLKSKKDAQGKLTGFFVCSECGDLFKRNPNSPNEMNQIFAFHAEAVHKKKPSGDVNQAAAHRLKAG
jgi:hypothetical protein